MTPDEVELPQITNNTTELLAAMIALENTSVGWSGLLTSDSQCTISRLKRPDMSMEGVPFKIKVRLQSIMRDRPNVEFKLVAGHPSKKDLARGTKRGHQVSEHNVECDRICKMYCEKLLNEKNIILRRSQT